MLQIFPVSLILVVFWVNLSFLWKLSHGGSLLHFHSHVKNKGFFFLQEFMIGSVTAASFIHHYA